ncbi:hypothetical protein J6590_003865 [Homalodisca vitripennis]|nr:hypothetical protein J6590_003865 [Homalodisca vitripennis]
MADRSRSLDFESELEIAQVQILPVTVALFISTIDLVLYRLSPLFCLIRSSHRPTCFLETGIHVRLEEIQKKVDDEDLQNRVFASLRNQRHLDYKINPTWLSHLGALQRTVVVFRGRKGRTSALVRCLPINQQFCMLSLITRVPAELIVPREVIARAHGPGYLDKAVLRPCRVATPCRAQPRINLQPNGEIVTVAVHVLPRSGYGVRRGTALGLTLFQSGQRLVTGDSRTFTGCHEDDKNKAGARVNVHS